jgi:hypothetical protein
MKILTLAAVWHGLNIELKLLWDTKFPDFAISLTHNELKIIIVKCICVVIS